MLRVIEFLSLDGVMQAPGAADEDTEGGFQHGGWQRPYFDDVLGQTAAAGMAETDAYLFGRKTHEKMAAYWPTAPEDDPYGRHLNSTPKYVASRTLQALEWQNSTLIEGDVAEEVAGLKASRARTSLFWAAAISSRRSSSTIWSTSSSSRCTRSSSGAASGCFVIPTRSES
jgi:dihydrofolate reductase